MKNDALFRSFCQGIREDLEEGFVMNEETREAPEGIRSPHSTEIPGAEHINVTKCSGCGADIDTSTVASFSKVVCPACGAQTDVPAKFDHFTLLKRLGAGGMGTVFLANDDSLGRRVAVKMMQDTLGTDPKALAVFRNEAQNAAKLNHPHVAQIYSFGEWHGVPYLEMEFVPGKSLESMISSGIKLDCAFVMRVGLEVAEGLRAAEGTGLFHGDIKPDNILFNDQMSSKLIDFGIASMASQGRSNELWGTPYYIAPEKVQKKKNSARSDIYSLGATLYHAIAGEPPYEGEDAVAVIKARFAGPPVPLDQIRPDIEPEAARIIGRMMYNDLFMRYPNYGSLINDIKNYLGPISAIRKQGPLPREFARKTSMPTGFVTGAMEGVVPVEEDSRPKGKQGKKFVVQKGAVESQAAYSAAYGQQNPSAMMNVATTQSGMQPGVKEKPSGNPAKVALVAGLVFFVVLIVGAIGIGIFLLTKNIKADKIAKDNFAKLQREEESYTSLDGEMAACLQRMVAQDTAMQEVMADLGKVYKEATGTDIIIPDLEPPPPPKPEPVSEPAPADTTNVVEQATSVVVDAASVEGDAAVPVEGSEPAVAEEGAVAEVAQEEETPVEEAPVEETPVEETPAGPADPLIAAAEEYVYPGARSIRAALRRCEAIVAEPLAVFAEVKAGASPEAISAELKARAEAREARLSKIDEMNSLISAADNTLKGMKRGIVQVSLAGEKLIAERKRQQLEMEKAAALEKEEREKRVAEARAKAISDGEIERVRTVFGKKKEMVDSFEYDRIIAEMNRMQNELTTEEGRAELKWTLERLARIKSLHEFIFDDLRRNGQLRRGYRNFDIMGVSSDGKNLMLPMNRKIPVESLTVGDWMNLVGLLLERRPAGRQIGVVEHGEQLFNAAVFSYVHGAGDPRAMTKANYLANEALKKKSSLRVDMSDLLPVFEEIKEGNAAPPGGTDATPIAGGEADGQLPGW